MGRARRRLLVAVLAGALAMPVVVWPLGGGSGDRAKAVPTIEHPGPMSSLEVLATMQAPARDE